MDPFLAKASQYRLPTQRCAIHHLKAVVIFRFFVESVNRYTQLLTNDCVQKDYANKVGELVRKGCPHFSVPYQTNDSSIQQLTGTRERGR